MLAGSALGFATTHRGEQHGEGHHVDKWNLSKPVPEPGMEMCTMEIMPGFQAPTTMFVVGAADKGVKASGPGYFCGEQGCGPMNEGDIAPEPGMFGAMMAPGAKFPEKAIGYMGC